LIAVAQALHDIEIVVYEKHLRRATCILLVNLDERVDTALIIGLGEIPVEVILPEDTRITFVREYKGIGEQLVVNDWTVTHHIVVLDEGDSLLGAVPYQDSAFCEVAEAESVAVAQVTQTPAQWEIKRTDRIVRPRICFIEPIIDRAFAVPAFTDGVRFEAGASARRAVPESSEPSSRRNP
jgi:hypothetical protein